MRWGELTQAEPELASVVRSAFAATRLAFLGTLRSDGSPRISPIEPYFAGGELLIGAMAWSHKAVDLSHDPRLVLHNALTGPDNGEAEVKLYGRALAAGPASRASCPDAWWAAALDADALVFAVDITEALHIEWHLDASEFIATSWSPATGARVRRRSYP